MRHVLAFAVLVAAAPFAMAAEPAARPDKAEVRDWRYLVGIHEIAAADDDERLKTLVTENPDRALARNAEGQTPVHAATMAGSLKSLRVLSKAGCDLNAFDNKRRTPLSLAIADDFANTAKTLLELGADVNKAAFYDAGGSEKLQPPLVIAARRGDVELVKLLLDNKAKIDQKSGDGATALTAAASAAHWDVVNLLVDRGADPNLKDGAGATALLAATNAQNEKTVENLLEHHANPRLIDASGRAPLSVTDSPKLWKLLIDKGADVNVVVGGSTPLQHFIAQGKLGLVKAGVYRANPRG